MDKVRILVVDDEKDVCNMIKTMLGASGYEVSTAFDGTEGLKKATGEQPDLILLDIMLPDINGFEVLHRLRHNTETEHIPIVIISVKRDTGSLFQSIQLRSIDYITKPFTSQELLKIVGKCLSLFGPQKSRLKFKPTSRIGDKLQTAEKALDLLLKGESVPKDFLEKARDEIAEVMKLLGGVSKRTYYSL